MGNTVQNTTGHLSGAHAKVERLSGGIRITGLCAAQPEGEGIAAQCRAALELGATLLSDYGYSMQDVTRVTYLVSDTRDFPSCFPTLRHVFSDISPSVTLMWVKRFANPDVKIEFELGVEPVLV
nr:Rid family hydrolase [uncultured Acetobacter sp.]